MSSQGKLIHNKVYEKRGIPFSIKDYPKNIQDLWKEKNRSVDEIIDSLPSKVTLAISFLASQPRGFLRALGKRKDFEEIICLASFLLEPYEFLSYPFSKYYAFYYGPIERILHDKMEKTVYFLPKQYTQVHGVVEHFSPQYCVHSATVPNEDGYINLSLNNAADEPYLRQAIKDPNKKVILEINCYNPWVYGDPEFGNHCVHISEVDFVYENHEPLFQLPIITPTEKEKKIAELASEFIKDKCTIQFGIGGIPNYIASQIKKKRDLGIHTEMLTDWIVDLYEAGAISNKYKGHRDGKSICTFIVGTDRLYDWVDRNENLSILPIFEVNDPYKVGKCKNFISINAGLMIDLTGQICSESIGHRQYSGTGGQFEFVQGAQLSPGGRSIICIKSSANVKGKEVSNILSSLPLGSAITVPRFFTDTVITEYGVAELKYRCKSERAKSLINIAHPNFRESLIKEARELKIIQEDVGFSKISQKIAYKGLGTLLKIKNFLKKFRK